MALKKYKYSISNITKIKKSLLNDKIIFRDTGKSLVIDYEVGTMAKQAPEWFQNWVESDFRPFKQNVESRLTNIENCPTIRKETNQQTKTNTRFTKSKKYR